MHNCCPKSQKQNNELANNAKITGLRKYRERAADEGCDIFFFLKRNNFLQSMDAAFFLETIRDSSMIKKF